MEPTSSALGLMVIVVLYIAIGAISAAGSVYLSKLISSAKQEQIFFGLFRIPIAGFYLAFPAHFGNKDARALEATAVAVFSVFGLVGIRVPFALVASSSRRDRRSISVAMQRIVAHGARYPIHFSEEAKTKAPAEAEPVQINSAA
jgi:hypothetical protein